ncbi:MAG: prephenate dehydrogenase [Solimonas sp.]
MSVRHLAVVGLGLIGGSFARALRSAGEVGRISGFDADPQQRQQALKLGVVDHIHETAEAAVRDADLVVLAVPVLRTGEALKACLPGLKADAVVTDVGSTKQSVLREVEAVCGRLPPWFVPGHPIAGTEKSGVANSFAELFRNHRVILTPHAAQAPAAKALVARLWQAVGARVVEMEAAEHDAVFAATSHLPHVIAYSFVDMLARLERSDEIFPNAGGGFRDFTRIASSSAQMWHDIVRANADAVGSLLDRQIDELQQIRQLMRDGRWDEVREVFARARAARERHLAQIE